MVRWDRKCGSWQARGAWLEVARTCSASSPQSTVRFWKCCCHLKDVSPCWRLGKEIFSRNSSLKNKWIHTFLGFLCNLLVLLTVLSLPPPFRVTTVALVHEGMFHFLVWSIYWPYLLLLCLAGSVTGTGPVTSLLWEEETSSPSSEVGVTTCMQRWTFQQRAGLCCCLPWCANPSHQRWDLLVWRMHR